MTTNNSLYQLRVSGTVVVADTGDFDSIIKYNPQDATTNPSLILAASRIPTYSKLINTAVEFAKQHGKTIEEKVENAVDRLLVEFGKEILKIVPGRVSTEVDARLSFDTQATIERAQKIVKYYEDAGVSKERVLIKIASTWEGIQAAKVLESQYSIHCNLTLLFSFPQAVASAEANVTIISPFNGRIRDWYVARTGGNYSGESDPGVLLVERIFNYYIKHDYKTIVMGASLRNIDEVKALAGVDYLTIPPKLLEGLLNSQESITRRLTVEGAMEKGDEKKSYIGNKSQFMFDMNEDAMATEKFSEGIRKFSADIVTLSQMMEERILA
ncbi:similar to Saccharomyces cerevisiae YGR043C NQM1 Transaldolase of unknown function [Maudiozyma saulgeensis]|uniref:Transaldolase n=1 Tax=Maudiozyma saulgeensis TaxID=1789683 RepID=A0A1X7RBL3_9SACH|nr:similar to Saccharomyces cerevisiae YGR043C NQM1 Transaldolase of unknown function [Kazachstania saulgeensis]